jgi:hypothetical protein
MTFYVLRALLLVCCALTVPRHAAGQLAVPAAPVAAAPVATAVRVTGDAPTVDGVLNDAIWQRARPSSDFIQQAPNAGQPATESTEVRLAYDDVALYVALRMFDAHPDSVISRLTRRDDATTSGDRATIFVDSYLDRRTAFMFSTTPSGSRADAQWFDDTRQDLAWDAVWDVATRIDSLGWTAEFRIPFSQLRFTSNGGGALVWGLQVKRDLAHRDEVSYWSPVGPNAGRMVSLFGELHGLERIPTPRRVELAPYVVSRVTTRPLDPGNPFHERTSMGGDAGADLRLGLTANFNLTATINPDFGQVEADPSVVNLGAYETSYPEKRPFFTEGAEIFRFPTMVPEGSVFYSRRIGRVPQRPASAPRRGYADNPGTTRVLGAAKVAGKTPAGWSVGVLSALTAEETAATLDSAGLRSEWVAEPLTHYGVARVSRNLNRGASGVGGIVTTTHRRLLDDPRLQVLRSAAYAGGVDVRHRYAGYEVTSWLLGTSMRGDTAAIAAAQRSAVHRFQRPDADHLSFDSTLTSMQGWAGEFAVNSLAGTGLHWNFTSGARSPGVDVNDGGFQTYADVWYLYGQVGYRRNVPGQRVRSWNVNIDLVPAWSFGMELNRLSSDIRAAVRLQNG